MLGKTTPRLYTPPLVEGPPGPCGCGCALTPETSYGFRAAEFAADTLRFPFDPWERWTVIHAGELLEDGRPRFRVVLLLVARQNGKSTIPVVLSLYWQFVEAHAITLITSTKVNYAKKTWLRSVKLAEAAAARDDADGEALRELMPHRGTKPAWYRTVNGEVESYTTEDCTVMIAAANGDAGRSLTIPRAVLDEFRQHPDYVTWEAVEGAMSAAWGSQIWLLSNMGDHKSVPLNEMRDDLLPGVVGLTDAEAAAAHGRQAPDPRTGLFEYSTTPNADPEDLEELAQANPNLGRRVDPDDLLAKARTAKARGGLALNAFKMNYMCLGVHVDDPAVSPVGWERGAVPGSLEGLRVAMVLDVALDERAADLYAAALLPDGRSRVDAVKSWDGPDCLAQVRKDLPALLAGLNVKPAKLGWIPGGPAAALAATLRDRKQPGWPPKGIAVEEIRGELSAVCMGFASRVLGGEVLHSDDPRLNAQVALARKLEQPSGTWIFRRKGGGYVQALYAAAAADHLARTLPPPKPSVGRPRLVSLD